MKVLPQRADPGWDDEGRDQVTIGVETPVVPLAVRATQMGLSEVLFCDQPSPDESYTRGGVKAVMLARQAADEIGEYFRGERREFEVELDWGQVSGFYKEVLEALLTVPYGQTISYSQLAQATGSPGAARAVGTALNQNPWPIVVPCHRVVHNDGTLGGYGGGLEIKRQLLALEAGA